MTLLSNRNHLIEFFTYTFIIYYFKCEGLLQYITFANGSDLYYFLNGLQYWLILVNAFKMLQSVL